MKIRSLLLFVILFVVSCGESAEPSSAGTKVVPTDTSAPIPTLESTNTAVPPTATESSGPKVKVNVNAANIRSGPGTDYQTSTVAQAGDVLEVIGTNDDGTWYNVVLPDDKTGWIGSSVVDVESPSRSVGVEIVEEEPNSVDKQTNGNSDAPSSSSPLIEISAGSANIRKGPGTMYEVVKVGMQGERCLVIGKIADESWYNIQMEDGVSAWIAASVVSEVSSGALEQVGVVSTIPAPSAPTIQLLPTATMTAPTVVPTQESPPPPPPAPSGGCCKVCRASKACGDSCISKDKSCNKGPGCACNASVDSGEFVAFAYEDIWCWLSTRANFS